MQIRLRVLALVLLAISAGGFAAVQPRTVEDPATNAPVLAPQYAPPAEVVDAHVLREGEALSQVLFRASLGDELSGLLLALQEHADPRRLLPRTSVLVRRWADSGSPRAVEVSLDPDHTVRLERDEVGWTSHMVLTPTVVDTVYVAGRLGEGDNIFNAITGHPGLDLPEAERISLAYKLADIYGWVLDFTHDMHPGDEFRVVYEREARPDGTSRASRVLVAEIVNQGHMLPAVLFDAYEAGPDYYGREGRSLRLQFRRYPVEIVRITSNFNWRRYHPVLKRNRPHLGTDFGTGYGAKILSTADGTVSFAAWDGGYGNLVKINHGNGYETRYAHLSRFAPGVKRGTRVKQGQVIGYSGATGLATAPHLHYELRQHGRPVNARSVRLPAAPPVPKSKMEEFRGILDARTTLLARTAVPDTGALPAD